MSESDPILRAAEAPEDAREDRALRPQMLDEFVGQAAARANLKVFIESARKRGEAMDHTLFHGPPGLGKTTLAQIMARELGVGFRMTSGPVLAKAGDLAAILTNLEARDVLFIDEIHRLNPAVEEVLYPALEDFELDLVIGEGPAARANLKVFIESARKRGEAMDHTLFHGPPGLGKTTLAQIMARELGVGFRMTSGPVLAKAGDLAAILTNLEARDVLFIDEIHRLNPAVEEVLYPALEDFELDLVIGEGPAARTVRIELQPFTLVGATTRMGLLTTPLRDRFGIPTRLEFYTVDELHKIVTRGAQMMGAPASEDGAAEIARRARGTPRIAGRLLRRVVDFAVVEGDGTVTQEIADRALTRLGVDHLGLDNGDRRYLRLMADHYGGGPVGIETLSAALSEARDALEEVIEPFLLQQGLIQRTPRGRMLAQRAWQHLGLEPPKEQGDLLL